MRARSFVATMRNLLTVVLLLLFCCCLHGLQPFRFPKVTFEALKGGGFRAYIQASCNLTSFEVDGLVNGKEFKGHTNVTENNHFVVNFGEKLEEGDVIWYVAKFIHNGLLYSNSDPKKTVITELLDTFPPLVSFKVLVGTSTLPTSDRVQTENVILEDNFSESVIDAKKWTIEQRIPTYYAKRGNFEFNSYENTKETISIKDGILYLKPVARTDVSGILDLREGCTTPNEKECHHRKDRIFIVPPVKSAKIVSKISCRYANVEVRAKLPIGDWIVPIIQLELNEGHNSIDIDNRIDPRIIIAYSRGNLHVCKNEDDELGSQWLYGGVLLRPDFKERNTLLKKQFSQAPYNSDFHTYNMEWSPGKISFYVDSRHYGDVITGQGFPEYNEHWKDADAPFNQEYFLSLGVLVGGIFDFPDQCTSGENPKPWMNGQPNTTKSFFQARNSWLNTWNGDDAALKIDYVKIWTV